jgi:hypothetical protein
VYGFIPPAFRGVHSADASQRAQQCASACVTTDGSDCHACFEQSVEHLQRIVDERGITQGTTSSGSTPARPGTPSVSDRPEP